MAAAPIPPPASAGPDAPQGLPGNQAVSPAPPKRDSSAAVVLNLVTDTIRNMRLIAKAVPQASLEVRDINDKLQSVMQKITAMQAPTESAAPPL